jgi:predicted alpha/beta-hydrolase family hydrolase
MKLGFDAKATRALLDALAVTTIDLTKRIAQTSLTDAGGKAMSGREAAAVLQGKLEEWRKATT